MNRTLFGGVVLLLITINLQGFSQTTINSSEPVFTDTTYECTVTVSGEVYEKVKMFGPGDSTVKIKKGKVIEVILIENIQSVKFHGRGFGMGALIGGATGFIAGFIVGGQKAGFSNDFEIGKGLLVGLLVALPTLAIGGGIGELLTKDDFFGLRKLNLNSKRTKLISLMRKYS